VAHQLLNRADVITVFQQMSRKRVAQNMRRSRLGYAHAKNKGDQPNSVRSSRHIELLNGVRAVPGLDTIDIELLTEFAPYHALILVDIEL
jgi:hypothetical protein